MRAKRSLWHKYVSIAVLNYNTSYHTSIGCEPSRVFHGRIPYNILDFKMGIRPQHAPIPFSENAQDFLDQGELIYQGVRRNAMQAYIKYKAYFDRKADAPKLKEADYVYVLQPKTDPQGSRFPFTEIRWFGPYIIEKCYLTTITWYAKLAPTRRKCFIACPCVRSHPPTSSRHKNNTTRLETRNGSVPQ